MNKVYKNSNSDELRVFNSNDIVVSKLSDCYDSDGQVLSYSDTTAYIEDADENITYAFENYDEFMELVDSGMEILGEETVKVITEYNGSNWKTYFFSSEFDDRGIWEEYNEFKFIKFISNYSYLNKALIKKDKKYYLIFGSKSECELEEITKKQYLEYKNN